MAHKLKKPISWLLSVAIMLTTMFVPLPIIAAADGGTVVGAFTVTGGTNGTDYSYADNVLTINSATALTIANTDPSTATTTDTIVVASASGADITLNGVNIDVSDTTSACAFNIDSSVAGKVTITLADDSVNYLKSYRICAGLQKGNADDCNLEITGGTEGSGKLTAKGSTGIGGGNACKSVSNITISGGIINASGSLQTGAGIGSYDGGSASNITISGGTVTATGTTNAAGIGGGGMDASGTNIKITGGTVTATGGQSAAGIGGGKYGVGSNITIENAIVKAMGGQYAAGIGGGAYRQGSNITITNSTVVATGGKSGAGIGGGQSSSYESASQTPSDTIKIINSTVTATGGEKGAGIGGGELRTATNIVIDGGSVKAVAGTDANAIGGGNGAASVVPVNSAGNHVYLKEVANPDSKTVYVDGTAYTPSIHSSDDKNLYLYLAAGNHTIQVGENADDKQDVPIREGEGKLEFEITTEGVEGTDYTYSVDTGILTIMTSKAVTIKNIDPDTAATNTIVVQKGTAADITLAGVNIDVSSMVNTCAFKIENESSANVTITLADGTTNILKSGNNCAGLQKNGSTSSGTLTIKGTGVLEATGGGSAAGIGGGGRGEMLHPKKDEYQGIASNITIEGGKITAKGGLLAAGLGGSRSSEYATSCSNITIDGGTVIASGGYGSAGIGGAHSGNCSNITINGGTVTATGGELGAGIGGGSDETGSDIVINGGSVKAVAGKDANAIGGGKNQSAVIPKNDSGKAVHLQTVENPSSDNVEVDGKTYTPVNHTAADSSDTNLYLYLTEGEHTIKVGDTSSNIKTDIDDSLYDLEVSAASDKPVEKDTDYTYDLATSTLTILTNTPITIANKASNAVTNHKIVVNSGVDANITLTGVKIDVSSDENACAFKIEDYSTGNVTITLADGTTNTLKSGEQCADLQKNGDTRSGTLTIQGTGSLTTNSYGYGAGIGGGNKGNGSNITINGGTITAKSAHGAGIGGGNGGGNGGNGSNITINGGIITAESANGAGIGGGIYALGSNIKICGGSVNATSTIGNAIGGGNGKAAVTPTNGIESVYLLELDTAGATAVTINGTAYPTKHGTESKIYVYLPAKTAASPNEITVDGKTTKLFYDTTAKKWITSVEKPAADTAEFTYTGSAQTYTLAASEYYTISDNTTQTNAGTYEITVSLNDTDTYAWSDGTTADLTYDFIIKKAKPEITLTTDLTSATAGTTITATASAQNPENAALTDIPAIELSCKVGDGAETTFTGSFVIPEGTATGTTITVYARTAASQNYEAAEETIEGTVICLHANKSDKWTTDGTYHWHICSDCSEPVDKAEHSGGTATCTSKAACTECGESYGEIDSDNHVNVSQTWSKDGTNHWHECGDCHTHLDEAAHSGGTATCTSKAVCTECGESYGEIDSANHVNVSHTWSKDSTGHWHACENCTEKVNFAAHTSSGAATPDTAETCTICGYEINPKTGYVAMPVITPNGGSFKGTQRVTITCATKGATIYYTTDGSTPTAASTKYTGAFTITATTTVKAIAVKDNMGDSSVVTAEFTYIETVSTPAISPDGGTFKDTQEVTITCATEGATIYYTTDGSVPTKSSAVYTEAFTISKTTTIKAIAIKNNMGDSEVVTVKFTKKSSGGSGGGGGGTGGGGSSNPTPSKPEINGKSADWATIAAEIANMTANSEITIELNGSYDVPVEVIKAIADKNIKATFVIDSWRSWKLNGAEISAPMAADLKAIQINSLTTSVLRGTVGIQFRLDGTNNPTKFSVSFKADFAGKFANLYKLDGDKLVFVDVVKVDESGNALLPVADKGDYVIMLSDFSDLSGDMDNDGKLTAADATATLKYVVNLISDGNILMADLDGDGKITARDALITLRKVVGLE